MIKKFTMKQWIEIKEMLVGMPAGGRLLARRRLEPTPSVGVASGNQPDMIYYE
jgi:hypothetical protein